MRDGQQAHTHMSINKRQIERKCHSDVSPSSLSPSPILAHPT
jgi:hypothetical protein